MQREWRSQNEYTNAFWTKAKEDLAEITGVADASVEQLNTMTITDEMLERARENVAKTQNELAEAKRMASRAWTSNKEDLYRQQRIDAERAKLMLSALESKTDQRHFELSKNLYEQFARMNDNLTLLEAETKNVRDSMGRYVTRRNDSGGFNTGADMYGARTFANELNSQVRKMQEDAMKERLERTNQMNYLSDSLVSEINNVLGNGEQTINSATQNVLNTLTPNIERTLDSMVSSSAGQVRSQAEKELRDAANRREAGQVDLSFLVNGSNIGNGTFDRNEANRLLDNLRTYANR
jgi:hypothetical protein